ncbi:DotH/IcmK family type IV secretion protein [Alcanivorax sp. 1008]|uniref:DotH/IcmK family type IV secretion protein n=1 Tax=Alcanivorax sp. 1008 TaxID=2816853 RepID=UPI001DA42D42|nr:DotH/IcmK family type IV secretion protein [Alcanivorax sp. 1008]MCC1496704.1 hypothetical protein [Alcanivorax sp. 1008]
MSPTTEGAIRDTMPVPPEEITIYRRYSDDVSRAVNEPLRPPAPEVRSVKLNTGPGALPPVIQVQPGFDTTINFVDVTGNAWPVVEAGTGRPDNYMVKVTAESSVTIRPTAAYQLSNLRVHLKGYPRPLAFTMLHDASAVDYDVTAIMPIMNPETDIARMVQSRIQSEAPGLPEAVLTQFLDGVAVRDAQRIMLTGNSKTDAFWYKGKLIIRSPLRLMSPRPTTKLAGHSGYAVYVAEQARAVVLLIDESTGQPVHVQLSLTQDIREKSMQAAAGETR